MNSKSVEKSKLKNAENQARTLNLIIAKMVSNIWKGKEERLQEKIQKFRDTICRSKNILISLLELNIDNTRY
ncbi:MAG: hypothetical protein J6C46_02850 [Clostridia bacterium]|nr:hypothetical protein [Clostridia bacterium]